MDETIWLYDFYVYFAAAQVLHAGGNPYDFEQYRQAMIHLGFPASKQVVPFPYPPWSLWFNYGYGVFSFRSAQLISCILNVIVGSCSLVFLTRQSGTSPNWLSPFKLFLLVLSFVPFLKGLFFGQQLWLLLLGLAGYLYFRKGGAPIISGLALSLTIFKPHLSIAIYGFLVGEALRTRRYQYMTGLLLGSLCQMILSLVFCPQGIESLSLTMLTPHGKAESQVLSASFIDLLAHQFSPIIVRGGALLITFLVGLVIGEKTADSLDLTTQVSVLLPLSLFLSPYAWSHDYLLLFPAFVSSILLLNKSRETSFLTLWAGSGLVMGMLLILLHEALVPLVLLPSMYSSWHVLVKRLERL